jgi:DHA1 family bicyclomycin/chloramphenicol resistance-like MFS transporter
MRPSLLTRLRSAPLSFAEFVAMMAAAMAIYALAIDTMLPALPTIGRSFAVQNGNQLQWIVTFFVAGGGMGQLFYGPLADRFGRRPVLLFGLLLYALLSLLASFSPSLPMLLGLRVMQGLAGAAGSVIPRSIVRDRHGGAQMAKVMSITFIIFLTVPVVAPSVGQALLLLMPWRGIFFFLALSACSVAAWIALRLPETMHPTHRRPLSASHVAAAALKVLREPTSIFYTLATTALFGSLMAYISTLPQIFETAFRRPALMPTVFAICAGTMALCSFFNVRIVERVGMRRVSHGALVGFVLFSGTHLAVALGGRETLVSFILLQALTMGCFGLAASNFNAIAMHHMAAIAGSAASVQGVITMVGGALLGSLIGHQWSGHVAFLPAGAFCCGALALASLLIAEKARLFRKDPVAPAVKHDQA